MNPFLGPILFFEALLLLFTSSSLIKKALLPGLVSFLATISTFYFVNKYSQFLISWSPYLSELNKAFSLFDNLLGIILSLLLAIFIVMVVALPLCEPLAAEVDRRKGGEEVEVGLIQGILGGLSLSIKLLVIGLSMSLLLTFLSFIPLIGLLPGLFNLLVWTPLILSLDITDFLFSRRNLNLTQRFKLLTRSMVSTASVGLVTMPLLGTPFINLIGAPVAVIIGTLYARKLTENT